MFNGRPEIVLLSSLEWQAVCFVVVVVVVIVLVLSIFFRDVMSLIFCQIGRFIHVYILDAV